MLVYISFRPTVGKGLKELYNFPEVQMFLNCLQSKEIFNSKPIYQPGCLRKVLKMFSFSAILFMPI